MRPLNILFLYDCVYPDAQGGVEHRNLCLAQALIDRGHRVTLAGWFQKPPPTHKGITLLQLPFACPIYTSEGKRTVSASIRFAAACALLDLSAYDIVETANIPYLHLFPLALKTKKRGIPFLVTWYEFFGPFWATYTNKKRAPFFSFIEKLSVHLGSAVCSISPLTLDKITQHRSKKSPPHLLPCGVDLNQILRAQGRIPPPQPVTPLVFAGRLIPEKRVDLLLEALALLPAQQTDEPLLSIIGDGPDRPRLDRLATELNLSSKVVFTGKLPNITDVWAVMASARIAVQPSSREGFGLFPLEAMALGKPTVYCFGPDNAICQVVRHEIEGLGCRPTPQDLAQTLDRLLTSPPLWSRLHHAAHTRAASFDWRLIAKDMELLLYNMLGYGEPVAPCSSSASAPLFNRDAA